MKPSNKGSARQGWLRPASAHGFTVIELLVVFAVVALLTALLLPALNQSRGRAEGVMCINNVKQLTLAWLLYAEENEDFLVNNHGIAETLLKRQNWVNNVLDWSRSDENTNLMRITSGKLAPYAEWNTSIYKCPSDITPAMNGPRTRSMSMNGMVGNPGMLTNQYNADYVQYFRSADIPDPSGTFVFLDEHPDTINDGFFVNRLDEYKWHNLPASYHNGAANFSFADGHTEPHRWVVPDTKRPSRQGAVSSEFSANPHFDFQWLKDRTSVKK